jgi:hypothetical protein
MRAKRNDMCRELQVPRFKSAALTVVSCIILMTTTSHAQRHHKQTDDNGIHVGQPKVYDSRELTLMLDNLSLQLQGTNFINPTSLATALGNVQGYQNSDFSGSLFANGGVGPGAAAAFGGNAVAAATATPATTTAAPTVTINVAPTLSTGATATPAASAPAAATLGPQAPTLPTLQTAPNYTPTFGSNGSDLLSDEVNLTYQLYNVRMLVDRSLTDRLYGSESRLEAVVGFDIDLEPDEDSRDAAAVVEVTASMGSCTDGLKDHCATGASPSVVALMPEQGSHNAATLSQSAVGLGGAVAAAVYSAGISLQKRNQVFYLYRDMDTVSFEEPTPNQRFIKFGWQFRPVLGRHSIDPGMRHLMVVIGLPAADIGKNIPTLTLHVSTHWQRYNQKNQTTTEKGYVWHSLPGQQDYDLAGVEVPTSLETQDDLGPRISNVQWIPTDAGNGVAVVAGKNFFPGTTVQLGARAYRTTADGLTVKSDKELEVSAPLSVAVAGGALSGRYGKALALRSSLEDLEAGGVRITRLQLSPEGDDLDELVADVSILPDQHGHEVDFDQVTKQLNSPIVLVDGKPEPGTPHFFRNGDPVCDPNRKTPCSIPAQLIAFVPSKDLSKGSPQITVMFPFDGPNWTDTVPNFEPKLKVTRLGSDKDARLLITSTNGGDTLCKSYWVLQLEDGSEIPTTLPGKSVDFPKPAPGKPDLRGSSLECVDSHLQMLSLEISAKTLKPYHHFLLVNKPKPEEKALPQPPRVGDVPSPEPPPPGPSLDKDQKITVAQNDVRPITFTGKHLDQVTKVLFDKIPLRIVKQEDKDIVISLSRQETSRAPADIQLQLLSDGNDPVIAEFSVTVGKSAAAPKKGN